MINGLERERQRACELSYLRFRDWRFWVNPDALSNVLHEPASRISIGMFSSLFQSFSLFYFIFNGIAARGVSEEEARYAHNDNLIDIHATFLFGLVNRSTGSCTEAVLRQGKTFGGTCAVISVASRSTRPKEHVISSSYNSNEKETE